jgi:hypothetical protein
MYVVIYLNTYLVTRSKHTHYVYYKKVSFFVEKGPAAEATDAPQP